MWKTRHPLYPIAHVRARGPGVDATTLHAAADASEADQSSGEGREEPEKKTVDIGAVRKARLIARIRVRRVRLRYGSRQSPTLGVGIGVRKVNELERVNMDLL